MKTKQSKKEKSAKPEEKLTTEQKVRREVIAWFWVALVFLLINGTVGQARVIPSGSMKNTLLIGDHLIMSRLGYDAGIPFTDIHTPLWRAPKRQQIVIFRPVVPGDTSDVIKRVIGLPGETIDVHDGHVYINGAVLRENYTVGRTEPGSPLPFVQQSIGRSTLLPFTVPQNCFFVMGDNREDSLDSRFIGCVPRDHIIGTPVMIYMSIDTPSEPWASGAVLDRVSAYANALIHPSEVRWRRLFHIF
ncbi:MAG TPA: signal peptidase I [Candidatus Dormibacteraeota bacterium]|jgi:signal peptidase I|nr:signal peptidase I [Candidatus Dormibacteraeota bacterium]